MSWLNINMRGFGSTRPWSIRCRCCGGINTGVLHLTPGQIRTLCKSA